MTTPRKVLVFCNDGHHIPEVLASLRKRYPSSTLVAFVLPKIGLEESVGPLVDVIKVLRKPQYSLRDIMDCWELIRLIRQEQADVFVVLFNTFQLNCLASISGASYKECWDTENRIYALPSTLFGVLLSFAGRRLVGLYRYIWVSLEIFFTCREKVDYRCNEKLPNKNYPPQEI